MPPTTAPRTRLTAAERREQLLDVTKALVDEVGFHAVSIEAVARRAGITRPIVYGHFADLEGLLTSLLERETQRVLAQLAELLPHCADDLLMAQQRWLEAVRDDPATWRLVLMPPEGAPAVLRNRIHGGRAAIRSCLAQIGPAIESPDAELTGHVFQALSEEAARLLLTDPESFTVERLVDHSRWLVERLVG